MDKGRVLFQGKVKELNSNKKVKDCLDAIDGTPVLDIKPYYPRDRVGNPVIPEWVYRMMENYY